MVFRIVTMTSATGSNLRTVHRAVVESGIASVVLNISDRRSCGAIDVANSLSIPNWVVPFDEWRAASGIKDKVESQRLYHDQIARQLKEFERQSGEIDLIVLAYHRIISGRLLNEYAGKIINQHPGDLAVTSETDRGTRLLIGLDPVGTAYHLGHTETRSSTFVVDHTIDGGPLIARGPAVPFPAYLTGTREELREHEDRQKAESDQPSLHWVVSKLIDGDLRIEETGGTPRHIVTYQNNPVGPLGYSVSAKTGVSI